MTRSVSLKGRKFLYSHEGVVLKAYRDAVGVLTIGAGLTSASGVVTVKPGMTITAAENDRLVDLALRRNYVPRVLKALGASCSQAALDAGASFDYNTGKIHSASWVPAYLAGKSTETRRRLAMWNKGGGRVLPGLKRRRAEEADILLLGKYPKDIEAATATISEDSRFAIFVVSVTPEEVEAIKGGFAKVGFPVDTPSGNFSRTAVEAFQKAYDLTVDGKIGRATLSTLQRELDARTKATTAAGTTAIAAPAAAGAGEIAPATIDPGTIDLSALPDSAGLWLGGATVAIGVLYAAWLAWRYRDIVAVRLADRLPKTASFLRSF